MVKAYLRYELADTWGVISSRSSTCFDSTGKYFFASSLERVAVWDVKQAVLVRCTLHDMRLLGWTLFCGLVTYMFRWCLFLYLKLSMMYIFVQLRTLDVPSSVSEKKKAEVTCITFSGITHQLAVGYADGAVSFRKNNSNIFMNIIN